MLKVAKQYLPFLAAAVILSSSFLSISTLAKEVDNAASTAQEKPLKPNTIVILETNRGDITLELYDNKTPKTVENFVNYVKSGFYSDSIFHRVIPGFVIQGGGFTKELAKKKTKPAIKNEGSKEIKNIKGSLAMARLSAPHTATSQFFINLNDNTSHDYREYNPGYAVFGQVTEGMHVVDLIAKSKTSNIGMRKNMPIDSIIIQSAYVLSSSSPTAEVSTTEATDTLNENTPSATAPTQ